MVIKELDGDQENLGHRLKLLRGDDSQATFAQKFGILQTEVSKYERLEIRPPLEYLEAICRTRRVNMTWLVTGKGWSYSPYSQLDAETWVEDLVHGGGVRHTIILAYEGDYDEIRKARELLYGWLFYTEPGLLSLDGITSRIITTSGRGLIKNILHLLERKKIPVFKQQIDFDDIQDFSREHLNRVVTAKFSSEQPLNINEELDYINSLVTGQIAGVSRKIVDLVELLKNEPKDVDELLKRYKGRRANTKSVKKTPEHR